MTRQPLFGEGCTRVLSEFLGNHEVETVLLVTGRESFAGSGAEAALAPSLKHSKVVRFCDFSRNPRIEDVRHGMEIVSKAKPDLVVAVGGGSTLDIAKLVNVLGHQHDVDCLPVITGEASIRSRGVPLAAVPTTAGTGSEATQFAVVYVGTRKYSVNHPSVLPDYAVVDPELTYSMPPRLTAITGFDALSQAIESYWAVGANPESRNLAERAIRLLLRSLEPAVRRPDKEARANMALGAHLSGKAINISKTTAPHALSYTLTAEFGLPHGHAVALTLGNFVVINAELSDVDLNGGLTKDRVAQTMKDLCAVLDGDSPEECRDRLYGLMEDVGLETTLSNLGIQDPDDLRRIVDNVNAERLSNNPVCLTDDLILASLP